MGSTSTGSGITRHHCHLRMNAAFSSGRRRAIAHPSVTLLCLEPSRVKAPYAAAVGRAVAVVVVPLPLLPLLGRAAARGSMKRARYVMRSLAAVGNILGSRTLTH